MAGCKCYDTVLSPNYPNGVGEARETLLTTQERTLDRKKRGRRRGIDSGRKRTLTNREMEERGGEEREEGVLLL